MRNDEILRLKYLMTIYWRLAVYVLVSVIVRTNTITMLELKGYYRVHVVYSEL